MRPRPEHAQRMAQLGQALRTGGGVVVVTAPQLFPTPPDVARVVVNLASIGPADRVLEPSAGMGALLQAMPPECPKVAVELNCELVRNLNRLQVPGVQLVTMADFLEIAPGHEIGLFDRVVMNPPFKDGADIKHITHALQFLRPGGRLVAICANGPRQAKKLKPLAAHWCELPAGTFKDAGTNVNTAILIIDKGK